MDHSTNTDGLSMLAKAAAAAHVIVAGGGKTVSNDIGETSRTPLIVNPQSSLQMPPSVTYCNRQKGESLRLVLNNVVGSYVTGM